MTDNVIDEPRATLDPEILDLAARLFDWARSGDAATLAAKVPMATSAGQNGAILQRKLENVIGLERGLRTGAHGGRAEWSQGENRGRLRRRGFARGDPPAPSRRGDRPGAV